MSKIRRKVKIFWSIVFVFIFSLALSWFLVFRHYKYTTDAYVAGNQILITPLQDGFITDIYTDNTFLVAKNQLLVQLDPTDAQIAFDAAADALGKVVRETCKAFHQAFAYAAEIEVRKAILIKDVQDWVHRINVIEQGGVSLENLQHAEAALGTSYYHLVQAKKHYQKEMSLLQGQSIQSNPFVQKAAQTLTEAWVKLYRCRVYSPVEGIVAERTGQVGMWVSSGQSMMSVIPLDQIWAHANFKETQMDKMRIGQKVKMTADMYGLGVVYNGTIAGLPGGAGNAFSLLPPQNLSGNWIKIVQRLPVRVALDMEELKAHPLRIGMTMRALVDLRDKEGLLVPDNTKGPHYTTNIYAEETWGANDYVNDVIAKNIDPLLSYYREHAIEMIDLPDEDSLLQVPELEGVDMRNAPVPGSFPSKLRR